MKSDCRSQLWLNGNLSDGQASKAFVIYQCWNRHPELGLRIMFRQQKQRFKHDVHGEKLSTEELPLLNDFLILISTGLDDMALVMTHMRICSLAGRVTMALYSAYGVESSHYIYLILIHIFGWVAVGGAIVWDCVHQLVFVGQFVEDFIFGEYVVLLKWRLLWLSWVGKIWRVVALTLEACFSPFFNFSFTKPRKIKGTIIFIHEYSLVVLDLL